MILKDTNVYRKKSIINVKNIEIKNFVWILKK